MSRAPQVGDIDDENSILATKVRLTRNEYNATIRNKLEYNRLKVINRHYNDQNDLNACKLRTTVHDLRKGMDDNQAIICHVEDFFTKRQVITSFSFYGTESIP